MCVCMCNTVVMILQNIGCTYVCIHACVHIRMCTYKCVHVSDDPVDLLIDYFKKFSHKLYCFDDTHHFITKLLSTADADKVSMAALIISCDV